MRFKAFLSLPVLIAFNLAPQAFGAAPASFKEYCAAMANLPDGQKAIVTRLLTVAANVAGGPVSSDKAEQILLQQKQISLAMSAGAGLDFPPDPVQLDFTPLLTLPQIEMLDLSGNSKQQGQDFAVLAQLPQLKMLNLANTNFSNIDVLRTFPKLSDVSLVRMDATLVPQLTSLAKLPLTTLHLGSLQNHSNVPIDINSLSKLPGLVHIDLSMNTIQDLTPLTLLPALQEANLDSVKTTNDPTAALKHLTGLVNLSLKNVKLPSFDFLSALTKLTSLNLQRTRVADLNPLKGSTALTELDLSYTRVSDVSPLKALINLHVLNVSDDQVKSLAPLAALPLTELYVAQNPVTDIATLAPVTSLQKLGARGMHIGSLDWLSGMTSLQQLDLSGNQVSDLSPLARLTSLTWLDLSQNEISNIQPLSGLVKLVLLRLSNNQVSDVSPLKSLVVIQTLLLTNEKDAHGKGVLTSIAALAALPDSALEGNITKTLGPKGRVVDFDVDTSALGKDEASCPVNITQPTVKRFCQIYRGL